MRINTNMAALNAWRNMSVNQSNTQKSLEKLSSGYRINRAADDAAGLAVSEKMRAQIRGTNMATRNAQDGISLVQTAEGALTETHSILQRMRELSVQASTSTLNSEDAAQVSTEFTQLKSEIDRIANNTKFNTRNLLDGQAGAKAWTNSTKFTVASAPSDALNGAQVTVTDTTIAVAAKNEVTIAGTAGATTAASSITLNGKIFDFAAGAKDNDIETTIRAASAETGVTASVNAGVISLSATKVGSATQINLAVSGATVTGVLATTLKAGADAVMTVNGATTAAKGNRVEILDGALKGVTVDVTATATGLNDTLKVFNQALKIQVGAEEGQQMSISIGDMSTKGLNIDNLTVDTQEHASTAITALDKAINSVSTQRASLGAIQNRLEHTVASLQVTSENLQGAESRIRDVDMASEMASFTKNNILMQASQSMLAQANQSTQGILALLR